MRLLAVGMLLGIGSMIVPGVAAAIPDSYVVVTEERTVTSHQNAMNFVYVACPSGTKVLSGGPEVTAVNHTGGLQREVGVAEIFQSYPADEGRGWVVEIRTPGRAEIEVKAVCSSVALEPDVQYRVINRFESVPTGTNVRFGLSCPSVPDTADTVIGGGILTSSRHSGRLFQSYPTDDGHGWVVEWENNNAPLGETVLARAVCMHVPRARYDDVMSGYQVVSAQISAPGLHGSKIVKAACPEGLRALAGGGFTTPQGTLRMGSSYPSGTRGIGTGFIYRPPVRGAGWTVGMRNDTTYSGNAVVKAICAFVP